MVLKKYLELFFFLLCTCIIFQTARCNTEDDEMGRASSSHSNLTQHAWTRQQLAGKAASRFTEPTYAISRSREHFRGGKTWKGPTAEVTLRCSALKTWFSPSFSLFSYPSFSRRCTINMLSYEHFNERRNDCGVANLSRVLLSNVPDGGGTSS